MFGSSSTPSMLRIRTDSRAVHGRSTPAPSERHGERTAPNDPPASHAKSHAQSCLEDLTPRPAMAVPGTAESPMGAAARLWVAQGERPHRVQRREKSPSSLRGDAYGIPERLRHPPPAHRWPDDVATVVCAGRRHLHGCATAAAALLHHALPGAAMRRLTLHAASSTEERRTADAALIGPSIATRRAIWTLLRTNAGQSRTLALRPQARRPSPSTSRRHAKTMEAALEEACRRVLGCGLVGCGHAHTRAVSISRGAAPPPVPSQRAGPACARSSADCQVGRKPSTGEPAPRRADAPVASSAPSTPGHPTPARAGGTIVTPHRTIRHARRRPTAWRRKLIADSARTATGGGGDEGAGSVACPSASAPSRCVRPTTMSTRPGVARARAALAPQGAWTTLIPPARSGVPAAVAKGETTGSPSSMPLARGLLLAAIAAAAIAAAATAAAIAAALTAAAISPNPVGVEGSGGSLPWPLHAFWREYYTRSCACLDPRLLPSAGSVHTPRPRAPPPTPPPGRERRGGAKRRPPTAASCALGSPPCRVRAARPPAGSISRRRLRDHQAMAPGWPRRALGAPATATTRDHACHPPTLPPYPREPPLYTLPLHSSARTANTHSSAYSSSLQHQGGPCRASAPSLSQSVASTGQAAPESHGPMVLRRNQPPRFYRCSRPPRSASSSRRRRAAYSGSTRSPL